MRLRIGPSALRFKSGEGDEAKQVVIIYGDGGALHSEGAMVADHGRVLVRPEDEAVFEEVIVAEVQPDDKYPQVHIAFTSDRNHRFTMMFRPGEILDFNGDRYRRESTELLEEVEVRLLSEL